jgi:hypothetical protein
MANGIQDLTSIMTQGGREDIPQPMMGGGLGGMMPPQTPPMSPPDMGGMPPEMGGVSPEMMMAEQMPMEEEPVSVEEDSVQLAGAVMERAGNDPETAVAILDGAAGLIMQSVQQEPMMAASGKYMKPKYAANGEYLGDESDTLRQMIMDRLKNSPITSMTDVTRGQGMILNEGDLMGMGRTMSDAEKDRALKGFNDKAMEAISLLDTEAAKRGITDIRQGFFDPETGEITEVDKDLRLEKFFEAYEKDPDGFSKDAEYYNMLEDERKKAAERAKLYRSR